MASPDTRERGRYHSVFFLEGQTLPIPGPSTKTKTARTTAEAAIQPQLRASPRGGSCARTEGVRGFAWYHARSEVPPRDAAAAEISTISIPRGLKIPATIKVAAPTKYGRSMRTFARRG